MSSGASLTMALAGRDAARLELGVVAGGKAAHPLEQAARLADLIEALVAHALGVEGDVLAQRPLEEPRVLQHHTKLLVEVLARDVGDVHAVDVDAAVAHLVEAHEEVHEGRLA